MTSNNYTPSEATYTPADSVRPIEENFPARLRDSNGNLTKAANKQMEAVKRGAKAAGRSAQDAVKATAKYAKEHPGIAAAALVGVGLAAGVLTHRILHREPTLGELLKETISRNATRASKAMGAVIR